MSVTDRLSIIIEMCHILGAYMFCISLKNYKKVAQNGNKKSTFVATSLHLLKYSIFTWFQ